MKPFSIIVSLDRLNGIGKDNSLPWQLPAQEQYFDNTTISTESEGTQNAIIMGKNTWNFHQAANRQFPGRVVVVVSNQADLDLPEDVLQFADLDEALIALSTSPKIENVFVVGGEKLYHAAVLHDYLDKMYITKIEHDFGCNHRFPDRIPGSFEIVAATEIQKDAEHEYAHYVLSKDAMESFAGGCCGGGCCGPTEQEESGCGRENCGNGACGSESCASKKSEDHGCGSGCSH